MNYLIGKTGHVAVCVRTSCGVDAMSSVLIGRMSLFALPAKIALPIIVVDSPEVAKVNVTDVDVSATVVVAVDHCLVIAVVDKAKKYDGETNTVSECIDDTPVRAGVYKLEKSPARGPLTEICDPTENSMVKSYKKNTDTTAVNNSKAFGVGPGADMNAAITTIV